VSFDVYFECKHVLVAKCCTLSDSMSYDVSSLHEVLEISKVIWGTILGPLFSLRDESGDPTAVAQRMLCCRDQIVV
jgi:F420-0:gamma-glutamyl ligase-like protein